MSEVVKTNIRLPVELKNEIDKIAEEEQLSINAAIVNLIQKALEETENNNTNTVTQNNDIEKLESKIDTLLNKINNNERIETLEDKIDFLLQQQQKLKEEIKQEMQKEILEDFKIFANVLAKKIKETNMQTETLLTINKPLKFQTIKNFAEAGKKPFVKKDDLIAAIDVYKETAELKIYKILQAETYNNIKAVNIKNAEDKITIDLTNEIHYLSILKIYRKI